jgi:hypothetical protein
MAGTLRTLLVGGSFLAGVAGGALTTSELTGEKYVDGAVNIEMVATTTAEKTVYTDKDGKLVDPEKLPESVKEEDVKAVVEPPVYVPPMAKINNMPDGKPIILRPDTKYRMLVEVDGKILAESEFTPDRNNYPDNGDSLVGVFKFDVRCDDVR